MITETHNIFHPLTSKIPGNRVKIYKHPASRATGFFYGTIQPNGSVLWDEPVPGNWNVNQSFQAPKGFNLILA